MLNANIIVDPRMAGLLRCNNCSMNFNSQHLLTKHKLKFCVGSTGDPDDLQLKRGFRSTSPRVIVSPEDRKIENRAKAPASPQLIATTRSAKSPPFLSQKLPGDIQEQSESFYRNPQMLKGGTFIDMEGDGAMSPDSVDLPGTPDPDVVEDKLYQLRKLKDQRSRSRDLHDLEERMLLDQLNDGEGSKSPMKQRNRMPLSKHRDVRDLQLEYEKLREKENINARQNPHMVSSRAGRQTPYSRNSNSSMSIHLDDEYRRNPNQDQQLRSLAQNHGRHMEYLNKRNLDLEKQREDIRKQLENLGRRTVVPPQDNTADLLRELREQEIRNQRALDDLKRQLHDLHGNQKVNVIEIEKPVYPQQPPPPPPPQPEPPKRPLVFPVYYGKSLVAEISAIRQAYLQNGGNDPDVLAQMSQMQAEAQAIEDQMNQKPEHKSPREKPKDNDATFRLLEMENDRLNQQLRLLQEQNILAQNRNKSDKEDELERELRRLQREHLEKMYGLQKELDDLRILLMMQRNQPPPPPPTQPNTIIHQAAQPPVSLLREKTPWLLQKPYVEVEPMAPYDQYPCNYVPAFHHTWNYNQIYKNSLIPNFPRSRNIDTADPGSDGYQPAPGSE
ncbi:uncharacterized protein LOC123523797 isoform X5 [Mercenaria mercenaria]|uniref:uncharacterized protein LOC123523797 isoform X5 n=1 Tax=Mercenaria mercenaria TaxID=6596 RepID=UPI00234EDC65|nr:uncharacterized protein LOC123523797 isoform X5 [Mercenaria mercenaria]